LMNSQVDPQMPQRSADNALHDRLVASGI
jgi:hypothetical protein